MPSGGFAPSLQLLGAAELESGVGEEPGPGGQPGRPCGAGLLPARARALRRSWCFEVGGGSGRVSLRPGDDPPGKALSLSIVLFLNFIGYMCSSSGAISLLSFHPFWSMLMSLICLAEMTLLSSQTPSLEPSSATTESAEQRMLEKRAKVIEELLQTERDYIRDLEMCVERIMVPLQQAQVGAGKGGEAVV